ncbi:MAG: DUF2235 domain-containing protein [Alphaproteobacteria bacterium]
MPKNIIICADGTGNSSRALFGTNVWRLYQALDTSIAVPHQTPAQIAYYHDGVGTSSFRPLALLGGAIGWGLKRNALDCYKFICRNYERGDRIYMFGFSRGAFSVRLLADFICTEGLVSRITEPDLDFYARDAYRVYRQKFDKGTLTKTARKKNLLWFQKQPKVVRFLSRIQRLPGIRLLLWLRNLSWVRSFRYWRDRLIDIRRFLQKRDRYKCVRKENIRPEKDRNPDALGDRHAIEFIGVWDSVAAYGMPIAEMTRGFDRWVWPLSFQKYALSPKVKTARQALALDDERDTFHPLLWDEFESERPERIKQVWFAGTHSDVGGGYPDGTMSHIPLKWMLDEAAIAGVGFVPRAVAEIRKAARTLGPMHDSRRGLAGYYRYQPRKIAAYIESSDGSADPSTLLMRDPYTTDKLLRSVKIHESVFHRIAFGNDGYAPIVLPREYEVVPGRMGGPVPPYGLDPRTREQRVEGQERVWDRVWVRRVLYFSSLTVSGLLVLLPVWQWWWSSTGCSGYFCFLSPTLSAVGWLLPEFAQPWISSFANSPDLALFLVGVLTLMLLANERVQQRLNADMRALWENTLGLDKKTTAPDALRRWVRRLRTNLIYQRVFRSLKWNVAPNAFGLIFRLAAIALLIAPIGIVGIIALRYEIARSEAANQMCGDAKSSEYATSEPCTALYPVLRAGESYRLFIKVDKPWVDLTISTTPEGFDSSKIGFFARMMAPLRRLPSARWFQPLVKIIEPDANVASASFLEELIDIIVPDAHYRIVPLDMRLTDPVRGIYTAEFEAPIGGHAYFFINDVLLPQFMDPVFGIIGHVFGNSWSYKIFYDNNQGGGSIDLIWCRPFDCPPYEPL